MGILFGLHATPFRSTPMELERVHMELEEISAKEFDPRVVAPPTALSIERSVSYSLSGAPALGTKAAKFSTVGYAAHLFENIYSEDWEFGGGSFGHAVERSAPMRLGSPDGKEMLSIDGLVDCHAHLIATGSPRKEPVVDVVCRFELSLVTTYLVPKEPSLAVWACASFYALDTPAPQGDGNLVLKIENVNEGEVVLTSPGQIVRIDPLMRRGDVAKVSAFWNASCIAKAGGGRGDQVRVGGILLFGVCLSYV